MTTPRHAAVILAAGASRRLGFSKQLLRIDGEPLARRAVLAALATAPVHAAIVVGSDAHEVFAAVNDLPVERVNSLQWSEGMGASLRAGVANADAVGCDGALIVLCDQPALTATHLQCLVDAWRAAPAHAVASAYANTVGVPALLPRDWFASVAQLTGDRGARDLLRERASEVRTVVAEELAHDIDQRADLS